MNRNTKIFIAAAALIIWICLAAILFLWKTGAKNYLSCYQVLYDAYSSDSIDMDVSVSVDSSLIDVYLDFNALKFPYRDSTATKFTIYDKMGRVEVYQIEEETFLSTGEKYTISDIPKDFNIFLKRCSQLYNSGYTISREQNGQSTRYQIEAPDDEVAALIKSYDGRLGEIDIQYSNCMLIITIEGGELRDIQLYGTASYTLPTGRKFNAYMKVKADINALGDEVEPYTVPEAFESFD